MKRLLAVLLLILPACQSSGPDDPVWQKREVNLKAMYMDKITALETEIEERKVKETVLTVSIKKLEDELKQVKAALAQSENGIAISTGQAQNTSVSASTQAIVSTGLPAVAGKILAINKNLNVLIISVNKNSGIQSGARYNVRRNDQMVGIIEINKVEKDWLTASPLQKDDVIRYKISDEVLLTGE